MEIYLIRHTTPDIPAGICYGQSDLDVAESFDDELAQVKSNLGKYGDFSNISCYSSPLRRCLKLAQSLKLGSVMTDDRLKEMDFGDWEMRAWDDIDRGELDRWGDDFVNISSTGGESYRELYERVVGFIESLKLGVDKRVVIVTHAGVIRSFLTYFGQTTLETSFDVKVSYGGVFRCLPKE